jgi:glycosyltransferase involved in cell wall biosynthesis
MEPFNVAAMKFISNMRNRGYDMVHYGHQSADVESENEICITNDELPPPENGDLFLHKPHLIELYNSRATQIVKRRKKPNDMILAFYGQANKTTMDDHPDLFLLEPSIGYPPEAVFAPYRAFVSYSQMHYYYGLHRRILDPSWYDAVITNGFTPEEFEFNTNKQDYILYFGRVVESKGINIAIQATERTGKRLVIAGPGELTDLGYKEIPEHVSCVGLCDAEDRKILMRDAKAIIGPTYYVEPFGNMVVEGYFSGTPAITSDWGGFTENVVHGVTGYRCREMRDFVHAINNIDKIDPYACRAYAEENYSELLDFIDFVFDNIKPIHDNTWIKNRVTPSTFASNTAWVTLTEFRKTGVKSKISAITDRAKPEELNKDKDIGW